jgi:ketosteroid isomerase-like protein
VSERASESPAQHDTAARVVEALTTLEPGDGLFAPGAVTWHSFDEVEAPTVPDTLESVRAIRAVVPDFGMVEVRTSPVVDGVSWARYAVTGTLPDGTTFRAPAALAVHVDGSGQVTRIEEYVDTAQLAGLFAALS